MLEGTTSQRWAGLLVADRARAGHRPDLLMPREFRMLLTITLRTALIQI